jgi:ectoine hydroxylase-related dioxygenase (phytanoyl-CoA dioxygenase family)
LRDERVLATVAHILAHPLRLFQLGGREPGPGHGLQGLHADWPPRKRVERAFVATSLWMLDDFQADNGATRVVPGTQRLPGLPPKRLADPAAHHPEELVVTGAAGDVLVFNGHLWHSGTRNQSGAPRRALQVIFGARDQLWYGLPPTARLEELEPEVRALLES